MEKGLQRLIEAAQAADDQQNHTIFLEVRPEGVVGRIVWEDRQRKYTMQEIVSWHEIHPRPDTKNPLITMLDALVRKRTEFGT